MTLQPVQIDQVPGNPGLDAYSSDQVANVAAKAYARIAEAWKLSNAVAAELIAVSPRTWARIKTGDWNGTLKRDQLMRISVVTGLYKALHLYFSDKLADRWVNLVNTGPLFRGRTPSDVMIEGGLPAMMDTRNYVDALRGGA
ncbi:MAG: antitoxin Xre-like helix-turn-helix domain-containing protein [Pseudomonadota bacterium]